MFSETVVKTINATVLFIFKILHEMTGTGTKFYDQVGPKID